MCEPPDVKRIVYGVELVDGLKSILYIGQDKSPNFNLEILSKLTLTLEELKVKYKSIILNTHVIKIYIL